jgi:shikimate dehydrogenase
MLRACVIGYPIQQSLSPKIHNYWLNKYDIKGHYTKTEVKPNELGDFVKNAKKELLGFNITTPHKEKIISFCDQLSQTAKKVGAVNTVYIKHNKLYGDNTDVYGIEQCILKNTNKLNKKQALIIGAGGACRACLIALKKMGFEKIIIANRTIEKAKKLSKEFQDEGTLIEAIGLDDLNDNLSCTTLLLNSSSAGMNDKNKLCINFKNANKDMIVCDIVYKPLITQLLLDAQKHKLHTIGGIDMLLYQAVAGFNYWFGVKPVVDKELRKRVLR